MCSLVFFGSHFHSVLNQGWSSALKYNLPAYSGLHIWQKDRGRCNAYRQTRFGRVALGKRRIQSLVIGIAMTGSLVEVSSWSVLVHPFKIYTHIIPNPLSSKLSTGKGWKGSRAGLKLQLFPAHIPRCCQGTWRHALAWTGFGWPVCGMVKCCLLKCYWTVSMMYIYRLFNTFKNNSQLWQTKAVCCFQSDLSRMTFQEKISCLGAFQTFVRRVEPICDISSGVSIFNTFLLTHPHKPAYQTGKLRTCSRMTSFLGGITNYDKPRSWEKGGPSPGEQNEVIRCFGSQKNPTRDMPPPKKTIEERLAAKAQSLSKAAAKWRRKKHINASERDSDSDSSTTSETSTLSAAFAAPARCEWKLWVFPLKLHSLVCHKRCAS